jgi:hypothetical protein
VLHNLQADNFSGVLCTADIHRFGRLPDISFTWNPGDLADGAGETSSSITATGAVLGDLVLVSAPYDLQGITCSGYVDAADSVKIRIQNETAGANINLASGSWKIRVYQLAS